MSIELKTILVCLVLLLWGIWGLLKTGDFKLGQTKITTIDICLLGPIVWIISFVVLCQDLLGFIKR